MGGRGERGDSDKARGSLLHLQLSNQFNRGGHVGGDGQMEGPRAKTTLQRSPALAWIIDSLS